MGAWIVGVPLAVSFELYLLFWNVIVSGIGVALAVYLSLDALTDLRGQLEIDDTTVRLTDSWWRKHRIPRTAIAAATSGNVRSLVDSFGKQKLSLLHFSRRTIGRIAEDLGVPVTDDRWSAKDLGYQKSTPFGIMYIFVAAALAICAFGTYNALQYHAFTTAGVCHNNGERGCVTLVPGVTVAAMNAVSSRSGSYTTLSFVKTSHVAPIKFNEDLTGLVAKGDRVELQMWHGAVAAIVYRGVQFDTSGMDIVEDDVLGLSGLIASLVFGGVTGLALAAERSKRRRVDAMKAFLANGDVSSVLPKGSADLVATPATYWQAVLWSAQRQFGMGRFDECVTMLVNAPTGYRTLFPSPAPAVDASQYLANAKWLVRCGNVTAAEAAIAAALSTDPTGAASEAAVLKARCAIAEGRSQDALAAMNAWFADAHDDSSPVAVLARITGVEAALSAGDATAASRYLEPLLAQQDGKMPIPGDAYLAALGNETTAIRAFSAELASLKGEADAGNRIVLAEDGMKLERPDPVIRAELLLSHIRLDCRKGNWPFAKDHFRKLASMPLTPPLRREAGTLVDTCMSGLQAAGKDTAWLAPYASAFTLQKGLPA